MMASSVRCWIAVAMFAAAFATPAIAQQTIQQTITESQARAMIRTMLDNIHRGQCGRGRCAPATASERRSPPVPVADARRAMAMGILSGFAEWCGLDWRRRSFAPFMRAQRAAGRSERALAMIGMMHGYMQGQMSGELEGGRACTSRDRARVERGLASR